MTKGKKRIELRVAYHPRPESEIIESDWNIRVVQGEQGYALNDGVFVNLAAARPV